MLDINNLSFIHLHSKSEKYYFPVLKIACGDETFLLDYTDDRFLDILWQVWLEYEKNPDMFVVGKFDLDEIEKCLEIGKYKADLAFVQDDSVLFSNMDINKIKVYESYLKEVVSQFVSLDYDDEIVFDNIHGHKNKYCLSFSVGSLNFNVCFHCFMKDGVLKFKSSYICSRVIPLEGYIDIRSDMVFVKWETAHQELYGTIVHTIDGFNERTFQTVDGCINSNFDLSFSSKEEDLVKFYLELCGYDGYDKLTKITSNTYLFLGLNFEDDRACTLVNGHITRLGDRVIVDFEKQFGFSPCDHSLFVADESYKVQSVVTLVDRDHALVEHRFISSSSSTCEYKGVDGKFSYEFIDGSCVSLNEPFEYEKYCILENVNDLDDIINGKRCVINNDKKLIMRR